MFFAGLGSVRIVKNCDLGLENAALVLRPRAAFKTSVTVFHITDLPAANNIHLSQLLELKVVNV